MKTFCEIVVSDFLPAIRALITKELIQNYGMTQTEVAKRMRITQPAISYYQHELRGTKVKTLQTNENLMRFVKEIAAEIANGIKKPVDMQKICERLQNEKILDEKDNAECCSLCNCS